MNQYTQANTVPRTLAFLAENAGFGFRRVELAEHLGVNEKTVRTATDKLMESGGIRLTLGFRKTKLFHIGELEAEQLTEAPTKPAALQVEKPAKYVGEIARPLKIDVWTPPLRGYEASLRAVAARAVAGR